MSVAAPRKRVAVPRKRSEAFALRWTAEEREAILERAGEHGMKVGPFMIAAAMGTLPEKESERERTLREILDRLDALERLAGLGGLG